MTIGLKDKILITGGWGFLGSHLTKKLRQFGYQNVRRMRSCYCNLISQQQTNTYLRRHRPKCIIHLAGVVGGIGANKENPGKFFYENMQMGLNILEYGRKFEVEKLVFVSTVCAYPKFTNVPFTENQLWNGYPEETNAPYGIAKRSLTEMARAYHHQYGMNIITLIPTNLYGPGDSFDPQRSHVIPALILKFWKARQDLRSTVICWGTGNVSREFLYVEDCAEAFILAMQKYNDPNPINIGNNREMFIKDLVGHIANEVGFMGLIRFDPSKPDGQPRRCLDTSKAKELFGFEATTNFKDGLKKTICWFKRHSDEITRSFGL